MASTYSSILRLELMGTGDQTGTWGVTNNTNLGTLLEAAIAGVASVSVTATPQALTYANGSADQARCAVLSLTTTTGANFTLCIPPKTKTYIIKNGSAYTATVTCATALGGTTPTGGTTISIAAGATVLAWSDATNVAVVQAQLSSVTGTLGVTNGGTGLATFTQGDIVYASASNTLAALAKNTTATRYMSNTGSSNSPAWAAVDLTNGVTGALPVANGGTGATTAADARTALGSTATGDAVFTAASAAAARSSLSAAASGANTDITSVNLDNTGLKIKDTNASHSLSIVPGSDLTNDRTLTINTGDAARSMTLSGNPTFPSTNGTMAAIDVEDQTLTGGAVVTVKSLGTISSGTVTPDPGDRPVQSYTNNGAHTLAPSINGGSIIVDITNGASASTITTSGFTKVTGDSFDYTAGLMFRCFISIGTAGSLLQVQAMY